MGIMADAGEDAGGMGDGTGKLPVFSGVVVLYTGMAVPFTHEPIIAYSAKSPFLSGGEKKRYNRRYILVVSYQVIQNIKTTGG